MTTVEKNVPRTPGRPRKFGQGRRNVMVRFTPERYAELRAEADQKGRSLSEQVEYEVERRRVLQGWVRNLRIMYLQARREEARLYEVQGWLRGELEDLKAAHAADAIEEKRLADIVEAAVARALAKPR